MSNNRHQSRSDLAHFKRQMSGSYLVTHLIAADVPLEDHPLLMNALANWQTARVSRQPICIGCRASLADPDAKVGGFLFALPVNVGSLVSTSAFCWQCWTTLSASELDASCTRVLRALSPNGKFLDAP
jgi:hypothetical protein